MSSQWKNVILLLALFISITNCRFIKNLYHTNEEIYNIFDNLAHHSSCSSILTGHTYIDKQTSNATKYYTITSNEPSEGEKTKIVLIFGEHARELITSELAIYLITNLCSVKTHTPSIYSSYTIDTILKQNELILVPLVNEYGRKRVEKGDFCQRNNENNVDINRNWDNHWKNETFANGENSGKYPFSEWETRNVVSLLQLVKPDAFFAAHSGWYSLFMPLGYKQVPVSSYSKKMIDMYEILNKINEKYCKCDSGPLSDKLDYPTQGSEIDYAFENLDIKYTFAFEIYKGESNNEYFKKLYASNKTHAFDYSKFKKKNFLQIGSQLKKLHYINDEGNSCFADVSEVIDNEFEECITDKNPLTRNEYDKVLINWTNVYFELFSIIYRKKNKK